MLALKSSVIVPSASYSLLLTARVEGVASGARGLIDQIGLIGTTPVATIGLASCLLTTTTSKDLVSASFVPSNADTVIDSRGGFRRGYGADSRGCYREFSVPATRSVVALVPKLAIVLSEDTAL